MTYTLLGKEYYKDKNKYLELYNSRFNNESSVKLPLEINGNKAFFIVTNEIAYKLGEIYKYHINTNMIFQDLPFVAQKFLISRTIIEEIILTNNIEGISSTKKEVELAIEESKKANNKKVRLLGIVKKYNELIKKEEIPLEKPEDIRALYDEFILDELEKKDYPDGKMFRKESVSVTTPTGKEIHKGNYPEEEIIENMKKSLDFLNDYSVQVNKLIKISIFHYLLGYIHPFYDGNGRLSRFISNYLLSRELEVNIALRLSHTIKNKINTYYKIFDICNDPNNKGDLTYFINSFLEFILESFKSFDSDLRDSTSKMEFYENILKNLKLSKKEKNVLFILIQDAIFDRKEGLSIKELNEILEISDPKTRELIKGLYEKNFIEYKMDGHKRRYAVILKNLEE